MDDVAAPGGEELRDRKRAEVYEHWLVLAREDDFIGVQNYERIVYGADGMVAAPEGVDVNGMGTAVEPDSLRGAVEYVYSVAQVPVLVSEHGIGTEDDSIRAGFIEPSLEGLAQAIARRRARARLLPLDAHGQLRVDLRLRPEARPARA